jgi:hypothetical protein
MMNGLASKVDSYTAGKKFHVFIGTKVSISCEISGSHGDKNEDDCLLGCCA